MGLFDGLDKGTVIFGDAEYQLAPIDIEVDDIAGEVTVTEDKFNYRRKGKLGSMSEAEREC